MQKCFFDFNHFIKIIIINILYQNLGPQIKLINWLWTATLYIYIYIKGQWTEICYIGFKSYLTPILILALSYSLPKDFSTSKQFNSSLTKTTKSSVLKSLLFWILQNWKLFSKDDEYLSFIFQSELFTQEFFIKWVIYQSTGLRWPVVLIEALEITAAISLPGN